MSFIVRQLARIKSAEQRISSDDRLAVALGTSGGFFFGAVYGKFGFQRMRLGFGNNGRQEKNSAKTVATWATLGGSAGATTAGMMLLLHYRPLYFAVASAGFCAVAARSAYRDAANQAKADRN